MVIKNVKRVEYKDCECCLEYINFKNNLMECKGLYCNNNYKKKKEIMKAYRGDLAKFSKHDIYKFILLFQKRCLTISL